MDRITKALKKLLPEDQMSDVAQAVQAMLDEAKGELDTEFNAKLEEAYEQAEGEIKSTENVAEQGYQQAYEIINDLQNRLENQREEFESALEEGFEEAYQMLQGEKSKNDNVEVELYEEFDNKLKEMKEFMVDKVDQFLQLQSEEIYESAKKEILTDPRMLEHKVALDKIIGVTSNYLSDEDYSSATSSQLEEAHKYLEEMKGQMRVLEARNVRVSTHNSKLNEQIREANQVISEATQTAVKEDKKDRTENAKKARGRGHRVADDSQIVSEYNNSSTETGEVVSEDVSPEMNDMLVLSGLKSSED